MNPKVTVFANGLLPEMGLTDFTVRDGRIAAIGPAAQPRDAIDLGGALVLPGLVDGHMHLDKTLFGLPWMAHAAGPVRASRIETDLRILPNLPLPARERAAHLVDKCIAFGTAHIRTHVDVRPEMGLTPLEEILALRAAYRGRVTIEIVAFPQAGVVRSPGTAELLDAAIGAGADLVGGIDPAVIDGDLPGQLDRVFAIAERRGVGIDIHLHEAGELGLFSLEEICARTKALGLQGKVTVSHGFCLGMVSESAAARAIAAMAEAGVMLVTHGGGGGIIPPILKLRAAGVTVFAGNDDIRDTWSPYGNGDMLERAALIGWKSDFRRDDQVEVAFDVASGAGAKALGIADHGLGVGARANFFTIEAGCIAEAVGGHPPRRLVVHEGKVVARDGRVVSAN